VPDYAYDFREQWLCVETTIASRKKWQSYLCGKSSVREWNHDRVSVFGCIRDCWILAVTGMIAALINGIKSCGP